MTALMWAAEKGHLDVLKQLVELGCALDLQDLQHGKTALMGAAAVGDLGIVRALLDAGASPDLRDNQGDKVHAWVGAGNQSAIVDELRKVRDRSAGARQVHSGVGEKVVLGIVIGLMSLGTAAAAAQQPKPRARPGAAAAATMVSDADGSVYRTVAIGKPGGERGAGRRLKEKGDTHWLENVGATDSTGFAALPGGDRFTNFLSNESRFDWLGLRGFYASSTEWGDKSVSCRDLQNLNPDVGRVRWTGRSGVFVRCVRD